MMTYEKGDVLLVLFPLSNFPKMKKRPALVVLDIDDDDIVLAPITTREWIGSGDLKLLDWKDSGLLQESWVRLAKVSCLPKSNIQKKLGHLSNEDDISIHNTWMELFKL